MIGSKHILLLTGKPSSICESLFVNLILATQGYWYCESVINSICTDHSVPAVDIGLMLRSTG